ncbi:MAG: flagellar motor protein [Chloroflexota bacterium]
MELSTLIGLLAGFGALMAAVFMEGGTPAELVGPSAALIVFGGTIGAALISFPLKRVIAVPKLIANSFKAYKSENTATIDLLVTLADKARREGLLSLEEDTKNIQDDFLRRGLTLVVDGVDPAQVRSILETETELMAQRHEQGAAVLQAMGGYAPTMGIIGTVMGLVNVLSRLSEPEHLGESIAVAFLATFYGILSANLLWLPIAGKLRAKSREEVESRQLMIEGILALQAGENPRIVREKLSAFLAPKERAKAEGSTKEAKA